ncbi:MAG: DUF4832 domain-containing protein [Verrucomicrobia bacterium]|nr:DUF4832 domain-containing protein [Verrucomicrobiota bacterium]
MRRLRSKLLVKPGGWGARMSVRRPETWMTRNGDRECPRSGLLPGIPGSIRTLAGILVCTAVLCCRGAADEQKPAATITVRPNDNGQALVNPDMGWTMHFYSNIPGNYGSKLEPSDTLDDFPALSTVYLRVPWAFLEPEEGKFNWALFDTPAQRWVAKGKRIALRVTCSENWMALATPEWVRKAGAKGYNYEFGKGRSEKGWTWDPDFGDPIFLEKFDRFLAALAARYDGNPNVAFVDVGSYGLWGEGHTFMSSQVSESEAPEQVKKHIDLHVKHFKRTLLCISDDVAGHDKPGRHFPETDYAISKGVTLRDDSILVHAPPRAWYHAEMAQEFWPRWPVILEHDHYGASKASHAWGDGHLLLKAVEDYHASYLSIHWWPREELNENRDLIDRINRRLGYRLQLRKLSWPREVIIGQPFPVRSLWANAGVAPCYPGGFMAVTLKDPKDGIVAVLVDEGFDLRDLKPGPAEQVAATERASEFVAGRVAPTTLPGDCAVYVSVGLRDGTPRIALPLSGDDGQHRYKLGQMVLRKSLP